MDGGGRGGRATGRGCGSVARARAKARAGVGAAVRARARVTGKAEVWMRASPRRGAASQRGRSTNYRASSTCCASVASILRLTPISA
eukprot:scaffold51602_cov54-Phaeocystis_antarctica.AAC.7